MVSSIHTQKHTHSSVHARPTFPTTASKRRRQFSDVGGPSKLEAQRPKNSLRRQKPLSPASFASLTCHSPHSLARAHTHTHNTQTHTCLLVCLAVRCPSFKYSVRTKRHVIQSVTIDDNAHRVLRPAGTLALTCTCPPGSRGTIKATTTSPFYTGVCVGMYVAMRLCMCGGVLICGIVVCILA